MRIHFPTLLALSLLTLLAHADTPTTQPSFAGQWDTTFGPMTLKQSAPDKLEGTYGPSSALSTLTGQLASRKFTFTYSEPNATGEGAFELAADGQSFTGQWREKNNPNWSPWSGKRRPGPPTNFDGLWKSSYGRMRLKQSGQTVTGIYSYAGRSTINGTVAPDGKTLDFSYNQPDGEKGTGKFLLNDNATTFAGDWTSAIGNAGKWSATRITPEENKTWLVVLERHWEHELAEPEYSFGLMLRTFFARVPSVQVRHRFFSTESDFRRWCAELPYLAEPVILHISSHGTPEGIPLADGKILGPDAIADAIKDIATLRLVHFGTCETAGGQVPLKIQTLLKQQSGPSTPISGYTNNADWAGSAVIDFTYLNLILERRLDPADAVKQTKILLPFANKNPLPNSSIAPAGLTIIIPAPNN
jgi:hypothetical protein